MIGDVWKCLEMIGDAWRCLEMIGDAWRCLEMIGDAWRCFDALHDFKKNRKSRRRRSKNSLVFIVNTFFKVSKEFQV